MLQRKWETVLSVSTLINLEPLKKRNQQLLSNMYKLTCWNLNHLFWAFFQSITTMICWSWNLFQSQCQCQSNLHTIFLLGCFFIVLSNRHFMICFSYKDAKEAYIADRLFKKIKIKSTIAGWYENPIKSVVLTFPLEDIVFPTVTLCPRDSRPDRWGSAIKIFDRLDTNCGSRRWESYSRVITGPLLQKFIFSQNVTVNKH